MLRNNDVVYKHRCENCGTEDAWTLGELLCTIVDAKDYTIPLDAENFIQEKLDEIRAVIIRQADPVSPKVA